MRARLLPFSLLFFFIACSQIEEHPEPSEEAKTVFLSEDLQAFENCQVGQRSYGYGTFDTEALNDLRHQVAVNDKANAVLLIKTEVYFQNKRITNYLRTPELHAPKATKDYYYEDAFTLRAKGIAYLCPQ